MLDLYAGYFHNIFIISPTLNSDEVCIAVPLGIVIKLTMRLHTLHRNGIMSANVHSEAKTWP